MKHIKDDDYEVETYPGQCILFFNLNELMESIPNAEDGLPTHRAKDPYCCPSDEVS